ncbi:MAG TPA: glycosyl hydrolase family 18 protein [Symbiobacteriaceae bacterium]|nr:glycosyl hydrolase family 18 protein [Symbiobacteriaceae bacterium]
MTEPRATPRPSPGTPRSPWPRWAAGLLLAASLAAAAAGGFEAGHRFAPAGMFDPVLIRAYLNRPLDTTVPGDGFWVAGCYVDYDSDSLEVVKTRSVHMDQVVVFGYGFDAEGNVIGKDQQIVRGLVGKQKRILLFGNLTGGAFSEETGHAILTDKVVQDRAVGGIMARAQELDAAGIQIDFENLAPTDREAYTAFLKRLKDELKPHGMTLSIAAAAKTSDTKEGWGGATDYAAVGQIVDQFYIMAYDEHWRGGEPGPVASLPWVEQVIRYATGVMPSQKIVLGIPFYGYDWPADGQGNGGKAYGSARMKLRMVENGAAVRWDPVKGENVATYQSDSGDRVVWFPDERSVEAKLKLAYQYNLRGIAPWRLGFEEDDWWTALGQFRVSPSK